MDCYLVQSIETIYEVGYALRTSESVASRNGSQRMPGHPPKIGY